MKIEEILNELRELYIEQALLEKQIKQLHQDLKDWATMADDIKEKINKLNYQKQ